MGLLDRLRGKTSGSREKIDSDAVVDDMLDPSSYCFIVFEGDHATAMPELLAACGYEPLRIGSAKGTPVGVQDNLSGGGSDRSIVRKAYWASPDMTVLFDPEMVIFTLNQDELAAFCSIRNTVARAVLWERLSKTAVLAEFSAEGLTRQTWYQEGRPTDEQRDPHPEIAANPSDDGIRAALGVLGIPVDQLFSSQQITLIELRE